MEHFPPWFSGCPFWVFLGFQVGESWKDLDLQSRHKKKTVRNDVIVEICFHLSFTIPFPIEQIFLFSNLDANPSNKLLSQLVSEFRGKKSSFCMFPSSNECWTIFLFALFVISDTNPGVVAPMLRFLGACHWHHSCHWLLQEVGKHSHSYCWAVERHLDWKVTLGFLGVSCVFYAKENGCSVCGTSIFSKAQRTSIFGINSDFSAKKGLLRFKSERARETRKQATQKNKPLHISYLYKCSETRFPNIKLLPNTDEISISRP